MTRKQFIESHGATCDNWTWSWSFINETEKIIIFGAWDIATEVEKARIFTEDWEVSSKGRRKAGYKQSREHIRLLEEGGYQLMTFPMEYSNAKRGDDNSGPATIGAFTPKISAKTLTRIGNSWYASDGKATNLLAEELNKSEKYPEGAKVSVTINAYERNPKARAACIANHGVTCLACGFNFQEIYGDVGKDFIHVHHIKSIGSIGEEYEVDPINDLLPVCPNCHAMVHQTRPPLKVQELKELLRKAHLNKQG